jgi:Leucine-rich repeat (LRR) protein
MEYTPEKILNEFNQRNLNKNSAIDQLISIIENSDRIKDRIKCIKILEQIGSQEESVFKYLENLLLSDSSEKIRDIAANAIRNLFFERALEPMKWALVHENSPIVLNTIYQTLIKLITSISTQQDSISRSLLLTEIKKIKKKDFNIGFQILSETKEIDKYTNDELVEILINYYTILLLEKTYWRLKSKIENCKIVELDFIFKGLIHIPDGIKNLKSLRKLILRYNQLFRVPEWIGSLKNLEILNLNVNNIKTLPDSIGFLTNLKELSLWKNELKSVPKTIGSLKSLEILNLRVNRISKLPDSLGNLQSLRELNLHDNKLSSLPDSMGALSSLEKLNLSWNNLTNLPDSIGHLVSLKILDLEINELSSIPESINSLSSLKSLNLRENQLQEIPSTIGNLQSLEILNLSRNNLKILPKSIISLGSLEELYLGDNKFDDISDITDKLEQNNVKIYLS